MARGASAHLTAVCALGSFAYISQSLERHSLTGRPRLSSVLILLISGILCFLTSIFSKWLPGAQGRFDGQQRGGRYSALPGALGTKPALVQMPPRPRRLSLPMLVLCIVLRLEIFHRVNSQQQCSTSGVESFLCILLWLYETLSNSRKLALSVPDDVDDPWRSIFTDISEWLSGPRQTMVMSGMAALLFCLGTYLSLGQVMKSTYFCFGAVDGRAWVLTLQVAGLLFDALIVILFWRMLAWLRTTKLKLRALGSTLVLSSVSIALVWFGNRFFRGARPLELAFGSLYGFDIAIDSTIFATLAMSSALWICDSAIVVPSAVLTIFIGVWASVNNVSRIGSWEQLSRSQAIIPPTLILLGVTWFAYTAEVRTFLFLKRIHVIVLLTVFLLSTSIYSLSVHPSTFPRHPLSDLIYKGHIEEDRWLKQVKISHNLPISVQVYQDRHEGRNPPPYFHEWYKMAKDTIMIDEFRQIDRDLAPFRKVPAKYLRQRVAIMSEVPGVATITIKSGGEVSHSDTGDKTKNLELDELVNIISKFAKFLPNMVLPMNLDPTPRILPSWSEVHSTARADLSTVLDFLQSQASPRDSITSDGIKQKQTDQLFFTSARDLQDMHLAACPPTSKSRTSPHWRISDFCFSCIRRHSKGPIVTKWDKSLEVCYQPDIYHLHGFFMTNPSLAPIKELLPLFSPSKMDGFSDIVFPLPNTIAFEPDIEKALSDRKDDLFWRGGFDEHTLSAQVLRGGHKTRLMHLVTATDPDEELNMVLSLPKVEEQLQDAGKAKGKKKVKDEFGYERVLTNEANKVSHFDLQLQQEDECLGPVCVIAKEVFPVASRSTPAEAFQHRYILLTDEYNGPPHGVIGALRSASVPFLSTTFRTWYTERLVPWLHFVPIDMRFQALHTTLTYFTGTEGRPTLNNRDTKMKDHFNDAQWIASQGRKWAEKALGQEDLEVYMFRLLLEWGRLIDDDRDKIGFWQDSEGELQSSGWTPQ